MQKNLTEGNITKTMLIFAAPMILGNLLQQFYNVADTLIVGRVLGANALAAVGSAYTLMTFLTSILLGLCMGSGIVFSIHYGGKNEDKLKSGIFVSFCMIALITVIINVTVLVFLDPILKLMKVPAEIYDMLRQYLKIIFVGIGFTFLNSYFSALLRAVGVSASPLIFLAISALLNVVLDLLFVMGFDWGVAGAAYATVIAQGVSAVGILVYTVLRFSYLKPERKHMRFHRETVGQILQYSILTCVQQSVMNFGILMIQGLVNSFGTTVMAAFAAAVKIDSFAYMPVQDFGNAFSTFIAQNYGAGKTKRIKKGIKSGILPALIFCVIISAGVWILAKPLMLIFVQPWETEILNVGISYLRIEGTFYCGIGCLFLFYGLFRAIGKPEISIVLTIISLGTRVVLAYILAPISYIGVLGIWWAIPIGWILADLAGLWYYFKYCRFQFDSSNSGINKG